MLLVAIMTPFMLFGQRSAFSLIELLVVVTVIAILMSMLIVTVQLVRTSARSVNCQSNLRQLGIGSIAYAADNSGFWPISEWPDGPWETRFWGVRVGGYIADFSGKAFIPGERPPVPFACPESKMSQMDYGNGGDYSKNVFAGGYKYGHWLSPKRMALYQVSQIMGYADNSGGRTPSDVGPREFAEWVGQSPATWGMGFWRHREKCTMVFMDGHVEARRLNQVQLASYYQAPWGWPGP